MRVSEHIHAYYMQHLFHYTHTHTHTHTHTNTHTHKHTHTNTHTQTHTHTHKHTHTHNTHTHKHTHTHTHMYAFMLSKINCRDEIPGSGSGMDGTSSESHPLLSPHGHQWCKLVTLSSDHCHVTIGQRYHSNARFHWPNLVDQHQKTYADYFMLFYPMKGSALC